MKYSPTPAESCDVPAIKAKMNEEQQKALVAAAFAAKEKAHAKYSHFPVGAALLCQDGTVVRGLREQVDNNMFGT